MPSPLASRRRAPVTLVRRRVAVALAPAALLAGLLAGCSSGDDGAPAGGATTPAATTPAAAGASAATFTRAADGTVTGLSYPGQDGETALALLLRADPDAQVKGSGENAFVTGIGGRTADDAKHEFWSLTVDGAQAKVGAGTLTTKDGETITWTLATY